MGLNDQTEYPEIPEFSPYFKKGEFDGMCLWFFNFDIGEGPEALPLFIIKRLHPILFHAMCCVAEIAWRDRSMECYDEKLKNETDQASNLHWEDQQLLATDKSEAWRMFRLSGGQSWE